MIRFVKKNEKFQNFGIAYSQTIKRLQLLCFWYQEQEVLSGAPFIFCMKIIMLMEKYRFEENIVSGKNNCKKLLEYMKKRVVSVGLFLSLSANIESCLKQIISICSQGSVIVSNMHMLKIKIIFISNLTDQNVGLALTSRPQTLNFLAAPSTPQHYIRPGVGSLLY